MFIDIQFNAEGFLAQETGNGPSEASGITAFSTDSTDPESWLKDPEGITWLVEEKRSPTVQNFTGTLSHVPSSVGGLCSNTVHAFAHFVYDSTDGKLIMADLQGKYSMHLINACCTYLMPFIIVLMIILL